VNKQAESYIKRELRSLGDVKVADYGEWRLQILAMEDIVGSGRKVGYTLAVVVTRSAIVLASDALKEWKSNTGLSVDSENDVYAHLLLKLLNEYIYERLYVYARGDTPGNDLRDSCEAAVTKFDIN
jgi:hypothetical protein